MAETLRGAIVSSLEIGIISKELLELVPQRNDQAYQREALILGQQAGLMALFRSYDNETQTEFRDSLVSAIKKTDRSKPEILSALIYLACDTETYAAVPEVVEIVDNLGSMDGESRHMMGSSLALMLRYSLESEAAKQFALGHLSRWFNDERFDTFSGSIMNSICTLKPDEFPNYFPRFLDIARRHPDYFFLDECIREAVRIVTPEKIVELSQRLTEEERELVQRFL